MQMLFRIFIFRAILTIGFMLTIMIKLQLTVTLFHRLQ